MYVLTRVTTSWLIPLDLPAAFNMVGYHVLLSSWELGPLLSGGSRKLMMNSTELCCIWCIFRFEAAETDNLKQGVIISWLEPDLLFFHTCSGFIAFYKQAAIKYLCAITSFLLALWILIFRKIVIYFSMREEALTKRQKRTYLHLGTNYYVHMIWVKEQNPHFYIHGSGVIY